MLGEGSINYHDGQNGLQSVIWINLLISNNIPLLVRHWHLVTIFIQLNSKSQVLFIMDNTLFQPNWYQHTWRHCFVQIRIWYCREIVPTFSQGVSKTCQKYKQHECHQNIIENWNERGMIYACTQTYVEASWNLRNIIQTQI